MPGQVPAYLERQFGGWIKGVESTTILLSSNMAVSTKGLPWQVWAIPITARPQLPKQSAYKKPSNMNCLNPSVTKPSTQPPKTSLASMLLLIWDSWEKMHMWRDTLTYLDVSQNTAEANQHSSVCSCDTQPLEYEWTHKLFSQNKQAWWQIHGISIQ